MPTTLLVTYRITSSTIVERSPLPVFTPPPVLCTDNGAMIAARAHYRFDALRSGWDLDPQPGMKFATA